MSSYILILSFKHAKTILNGKKKKKKKKKKFTNISKVYIYKNNYGRLPFLFFLSKLSC